MDRISCHNKTVRIKRTKFFDSLGRLYHESLVDDVIHESWVFPNELAGLESTVLSEIDSTSFRTTRVGTDRIDAQKRVGSRKWIAYALGAIFTLRISPVGSWTRAVSSRFKIVMVETE